MTTCSAATEIEEELIAGLTVDGAFVVESHCICELDDGHEGAHYSLVQTTDEGEDQWVGWADDASPRIVELPACDQDVGELVCVLMLDHPGSHRTC